jgi:hypothetical protein
MTAPTIPSAAKTLIKQLEGAVPSWSTKITHATGPCEFTGYGEYRGDGTRPQIKVTEQVDSCLIQACHVDGRAFVALWVRRPGLVMPETAAVKKVRPILLLLAASGLLDENGSALIGLVAGQVLWARKGWKLDLAWRGRRLIDPEDYTPKEITATQLKDYVEAPDHAAALVAVHGSVRSIEPAPVPEPELEEAA